MNNIYLVYATDRNGFPVGEKRITDENHLERCIETTKHDFSGLAINVNLAYFCFDGYIKQGSLIVTR